ncbi:GGDEF domain protein [Shewanella benthica KT99]|uniref:GGDEF domain protein n=1 Tax=Shewanella benthica KT99 TaxID=314608 RepID=A9D2J4_9GAMM|nr:GGDEF domain protein [Shewanella benthica KT99]
MAVLLGWAVVTLWRWGLLSFHASGYYAPSVLSFGSVCHSGAITTDVLLISYFSSVPKVELKHLLDHKRSADFEAMAVMLCLGGLIFIACYNLLIILPGDLGLTPILSNMQNLPHS